MFATVAIHTPRNSRVMAGTVNGAGAGGGGVTGGAGGGAVTPSPPEAQAVTIDSEDARSSPRAAVASCWCIP